MDEQGFSFAVGTGPPVVPSELGCLRDVADREGTTHSELSHPKTLLKWCIMQPTNLSLRSRQLKAVELLDGAFLDQHLGDLALVYTALGGVLIGSCVGECGISLARWLRRRAWSIVPGGSTDTGSSFVTGPSALHLD
jgi:hypothetical protein